MRKFVKMVFDRNIQVYLNSYRSFQNLWSVFLTQTLLWHSQIVRPNKTWPFLYSGQKTTTLLTTNLWQYASYTIPANRGGIHKHLKRHFQNISVLVNSKGHQLLLEEVDRFYCVNQFISSLVRFQLRSGHR